MDMEKILNSNVYFKILNFFNENPNSIDTAKGISIWTGIPPDITKKSLKQLSKLKLIIEHSTLSTLGYSYTQDKSILEKIKKWIKNK